MLQALGKFNGSPSQGRAVVDEHIYYFVCNQWPAKVTSESEGMRDSEPCVEPMAVNYVKTADYNKDGNSKLFGGLGRICRRRLQYSVA